MRAQLRRHIHVVVAGIIGRSLTIFFAKATWIGSKTLTVRFVAVAFGVGLFFGMLGSAGASHSSGLHIGSVHDANANENWCVHEDGYTGWATALGNIRRSLYGGSSWQDHAWDPAMLAYRVHFADFSADDCSFLPQRSAMWVEYWLRSENSSEPCRSSVTSSCVFLYQPYAGATHTEYFLAIARLYGPYTTGDAGPLGFYAHQVNHETGHVLGLADGDGTCSPASIMHSADYGCPGTGYPSNPSQSDIDTEISVANNP